MSDIQLYLIPGKDVEKEYLDIYNKTYEMWKKVWQDTITDEWNDVETKIFSDDFTRQDEIMTLFVDGECVGCIFFKEANFNEVTHREDSYFKVWSDIAIHQLLKHGKKVLVGCNFTLAKKFRKGSGGISWKGVFASLAVKRLLASDFDVMTGTMRRSKGMNDASYDVGAKKLQSNVDYNICGVNEPVDLVAFYRNDIIDLSHPALADVINNTWKNVISLALPVYEIEQDELKMSA